MLHVSSGKLCALCMHVCVCADVYETALQQGYIVVTVCIPWITAASVLHSEASANGTGE